MPTVKQAELLWCPMVRAANGNEANNCTINTDVASFGCLGDKCMMWRWGAYPIRQTRRCSNKRATIDDPQERLKFAIPPSWEFVPDEGDDAIWQESDQELEARRTGFCGLAGGVLS